jgi:Pterin-4a-carbinolamine dehydratase
MSLWTEKDDALHASLIFANFIEAITFMTEVAHYAEQLNHHPEWSNIYNKVDIKLTTHDANNTVTEKDRQLAAKIEGIYKSRWS